MKTTTNESDHQRRQIRLRQADGRLMASVLLNRNRIVPFPLPRLSLTTLHWSAALADSVRRLHAASVVLALTLDCERQTWATPILPTQVCEKRRTRWSFDLRDFDHFHPAIRVAGSYQSVYGKHDLLGLIDIIPPFDGVHVIEVHGRGTRHGSWIFIRSEAEAIIADPAATLVDDLDAAFRQYRDRLNLG